MKYSLFAYCMYRLLRKNFIRELSVLLDEKSARDMVRQAKKRYRAIIERIPQQNTGKNPFTMPSCIAALTVSLFQAGRGTVSAEEMGRVFSDAVEKHPVFKLVMNMRAKKMFTARSQDRWKSLASASRTAPFPPGFVFDFIPGTSIREYGLTFSACGICAMLQREQCLELAPSLCSFDFIMARYLGCRLTRTTTIAGGGGRCDFWYTKESSANGTAATE
jgi:hypothetical protein